MKNYTSKMLTHIIRLSDGHVMTDWIDSTDLDSELLRDNIESGKMDFKNHAVRMRKYPKELHLKNVITNTGSVW
tara:strand:+ start:2914 stop:3135 length:222 start_codon:yes stop_codon:yes gene_type:complete